jgi:hypothetical protein
VAKDDRTEVRALWPWWGEGMERKDTTLTFVRSRRPWRKVRRLIHQSPARSRSRGRLQLTSLALGSDSSVGLELLSDSSVALSSISAHILYAIRQRAPITPNTRPLDPACLTAHLESQPSPYQYWGMEDDKRERHRRQRTLKASPAFLSISPAFSVIVLSAYPLARAGRATRNMVGRTTENIVWCEFVWCGV